MSSYLKSIIFAAVLTVICGSLLTLASTGFKEYQLKNIALDKQKNILKSVGLIHDKKPLSPDTIDKLYAENIKQVWVDLSGKIIPEQNKSQDDLPVYLYVIQNNVQSYIIPVNSRGLW
ncbi:MAG: NADH:ubiquinone oxidoreductase subunit C, partial [Desulfobacterales bacterium]